MAGFWTAERPAATDRQRSSLKVCPSTRTKEPRDAGLWAQIGGKLEAGYGAGSLENGRIPLLRTL